jgi:hypothetical protein
MKLQRVILGLSLALAACADDEDAPGTLDPGTLDGSLLPVADGGASLDASLDAAILATACGKYGGPANVEQGIKQYVIFDLATDCAIGPHLFMLPANRLARLGDCLAIHTQELLGCPGVKYAGSRSPNGLECGGTAVDAGSGISQSDMDALLRAVAHGLRSAGIAQDDVAMVTPPLVALESELVQAVLETRAAPACVGDAGSALDASTGPLL